VLFAPAPTLVAQLAKPHSEGQLEDLLTYFGKPKLLIVDELGYLPFDQMRRTSSFTAFGDPTCADAILDRLLHGKGLRR
jgi:DNA replication protein DnaC